jgi:transcription elongation factor GreB
VSKAFTSEETPDLGPITRAPPRLAPGEVRPVTPEGAAALRAELDRLRSAGTPDAQARAELVDATLRALTVVGPGASPDGVAGFATWVTVEEPEGTRRAWRLVGPDETDPRRGLVSVHSPLGRALLGRRAGDLVEVQRPDGVVELEVVAVHRVEPAAGAAP